MQLLSTRKAQVDASDSRPSSSLSHLWKSSLVQNLFDRLRFDVKVRLVLGSNGGRGLDFAQPIIRGQRN